MRGHFSTPPLLVEQMLDACTYSSDRDLTELRVLDPACGSGNFLTAVAQRFVTSARRSGLRYAQLERAVQRNIWGVDPDPVSCFLAEMQLHSVLAEARADMAALHNPRPRPTLPLHIHQGDGLAFPWSQHPQIDLFLANPPYLASKNSDLSGYSSTRQSGQTDSYLLFLRLGLQIVRPGGWIAVVLPDPMLARANAYRERERLLAETKIHHLWHLSGVFAAYVGAVVIIAQKCPSSPLHQVTWMRGQWHDGAKVRRRRNIEAGISVEERSCIAQDVFRRQPRSELRYLLSRTQGHIVDRLHAYCSSAAALLEPRRFVSLSELVTIRRGEELGKDSPFLHSYEQANPCTSYPVLRGGVEVRSYVPPIASRWIDKAYISKPLKYYRVPKLLVVKSTGQLQVTLDLKGHIVLQTLYLLYLRKPALVSSEAASSPIPLAAYSDLLAYTREDEDELYFLLALLNSRVLQQYIYLLYTAYKWVQPQIEQHVLAHLPVPIAELREKAEIVRRARLLMAACSGLSSVVELDEEHNEIYKEQEQAISALYERTLPS